MCCMRQVCNVYCCGHLESQPPYFVSCDSRFCKTSPRHPSHCANCQETCWQNLQYPEQYSPHIDVWCPFCNTAAEIASSSGRCG